MGDEATKLRAGIAGLVGICMILCSCLMKSLAEGLLPGLLVSLLHEIGFALIVAVVIWVSCDYFSSSDREQEWKKRVEEITKNVFYAVLQKNLPADLIAAANSLVLDRQFIRGKTDITYLLTRNFLEVDGGVPIEYILADINFNYAVKNISASAQSFQVEVGLSANKNAHLNQFCVVNRGIWRKSGVENYFDISKESAAFQDRVSIRSSRFVLGHLILGAGESVEIDVNFTTPKDVEDSELITFYWPTESVTLSVIDQSETLEIDAASIHPKSLDYNPSSGRASFKKFSISSFLLPHQGINLWWNKKAQ